MSGFDSDEDILRTLTAVAQWPTLSVPQLIRLAGGALDLFARTTDPLVIDALLSLHPFLATRVPTTSRYELLRSTVVRVQERVCRYEALYPFLLYDSDLVIARTAALELAAHYEPGVDEVNDGPGRVLSLVLARRVANPGAALGGLLCLGDADVCARLVPLRKVLTRPELHPLLINFVMCEIGELHSATIEFYLDWLDELIRADQRCPVFATVASGLAVQRRNAVGELVTDGKRRYPAPAHGDTYKPGWRVIPLEKYSQSIAPRLLRLESLERAPQVMPYVNALWLQAGSAKDGEPVQPGVTPYLPYFH